MPSRDDIEIEQVNDPADGWQDEEDEDEDVATGLGHSTHTSRNPRLPLAPLRELPKKTKSTHDDLDDLAADQVDAAVRVAEKHGLKLLEAHRRVLAATRIKQPHKASMRNARMSLFCEETNEDCERGEKLLLREVQEIVNEDPTVLNKYDKDVVEERRLLLEKNRRLRKYGARRSRKSIIASAHKRIKLLMGEIEALADACSIVGVGFFARSSPHDTFDAICVESWGAGQFCRDVFKMAPHEFAEKFERWALGKNLLAPATDTLASLRKEVQFSVNSGFRNVTDNPKARMIFASYVRTIVLGKDVAIIGWPEDIKFTKLDRITDKNEMRRLRDGWRDGEIYWKKCPSDDEVADIKADFARREERGEYEEKEKKMRKDVGQSHEKRSTKTGKGKGKGKGKQTTSDTEQDEDEDDEEDGGKTGSDSEDAQHNDEGQGGPKKTAAASTKPTKVPVKRKRDAGTSASSHIIMCTGPPTSARYNAHPAFPPLVHIIMRTLPGSGPHQPGIFSSPPASRQDC
ncbi:hypothetical protein FB45DRAFT_1024199 [Roridomyces roridus]|uniref:Uncharacterized protein n=1 Tax=Roridomyces roridus TaxID=1738132 RepID=A0AAD7FRX5_9AGAR|nr:hypothetical protein FB45DRAFT_1024199 [Roridomyces roridus]